MLIDLRKMDDSTIEFDIVVEPSEVDLGVRYSKLGKPTGFSGKLRKEDWLIRVFGSFDAEIERRCDRCYKSTELSVAAEIDAAYIVYSSLNEKRETELEILGLDYLILEHRELDLKKVFAEQLLLAMPDKFVCKQGCSSICPECGQLKDSGKCECANESIDPRWAALSDLKKKL